MTKPTQLLALALLIMFARPSAGQTTNGNPGDGFQPLPRLVVQPDKDKNPVYVVNAKGKTLLGLDIQPNYVVANGRITSYTNTIKPREMAADSTNHPAANRVSQPPRPMLPQAAQKEFQTAIKSFLELKQKEPGRIVRLETLIAEANLQPEVQKKLLEIQKSVHDYINKKSPQDIEALERMSKPKEIMEHNGLPGNLVY